MRSMDTALPPRLHPLLYRDLIERALREDMGRAGDVTTDAIVPPDAMASARIVARREGRIAGMQVAAEVLRTVDPAIQVRVLVADGDDAAAGDTLAEIQGPARGILTGERVALNLLGRMCGIATTTRGIARAIEGTGAQVVCTRKTTPGLRALEKYAVRAGGGKNHRFGLDDAVLIKDNHLAVAGGVRPALRRAKAASGHMVKIELEVDSLAQLAEALEEGVDVVLLDNMSPDMLREAVALVNGRCLTEASGGITPKTAPAIAASGVDMMSVGWLTHSAPTLDVGLDIDL